MMARLSGSFRDPCGYLVRCGDDLYREITITYRPHYDVLMNSGLYETLVKKGILIPHTEVEPPYAIRENHFKTIKPVQIPFISYPYEWSFSQLKDAALLTLETMKVALDHDMVLKDASAYNIQFSAGRPIFIDTLSFEQYREGVPWAGYRQFCQHFLAPLVLMGNLDIRLSRLLLACIDGMPLDLASRLLPKRTWLNFHVLLHIHLHAISQRKYAKKSGLAGTGPRVSRHALLGLIDSLETHIHKITWNPKGTEWVNYYENTNYSESSLAAKKSVVQAFVERCAPAVVWDLGANTGVFSAIAADSGAYVIAFDSDPAAVEKHYLNLKERKAANILPLFQDFAAPSPCIGWMLAERDSFLKRGPADLGLALALIHHLAISNNVPLDQIALFFYEISKALVIEFVPKEDSQVQRLLAAREDIFVHYTRESFEEAFSQYFTIIARQNIKDTVRILYLMERK